MWYARSEAFMQQDLLETLRWVRTFGDVVFIVAALSIAAQVVKNLLPQRETAGELVEVRVRNDR
ncbi:hypothetical protein D3C76_716150 [compost metagenome]